MWISQLLKNKFATSVFLLSGKLNKHVGGAWIMGVVQTRWHLFIALHQTPIGKDLIKPMNNIKLKAMRKRNLPISYPN
jgi:hypothetical protein